MNHPDFLTLFTYGRMKLPIVAALISVIDTPHMDIWTVVALTRRTLRSEVH